MFCGTALSGFHESRPTGPERASFALGVNQSLHNDGPQAHYLFYYWNKPDFPRRTKCCARRRANISGWRVLAEKILGENTDLGLGVFGGGFANNYDEVRRGNYFRDESFDGHGGGANVSLYHLFNLDEQCR
jgi:hypothetical protein